MLNTELKLDIVWQRVILPQGICHQSQYAYYNPTLFGGSEDVQLFIYILNNVLLSNLRYRGWYFFNRTNGYQNQLSSASNCNAVNL